MSEIPKAYEPRSVEEKWYDFWLKENCFTANPASPKPPYSIVIPPPNITGMLHMGHVLNNTIQDILARKARMEGKEVLWLPGTDHAGIGTQTVVERALKKAGEMKHRDDLGREKFIERVWQWKEKYGGIIIQQLKKLGASCDWTRERFTMDEAYSRCVQKVFVELYRKGLIYRGKRMVNWDPSALTALSDEEVVMKEQKGALYYFKVEIAENPGTFLTIATTRPETIPGDAAVAVNPKDPRYLRFIGKHVVRPLPAEYPKEKKLIPIIGDEHVDLEFGTGVLKVTPAHDKADFEIYDRARARSLRGEAQYPFVQSPIEVIGPNGEMTEQAGEDLRGLDRFEARKVAAEKLAELGTLEKEEPYANNVGYSERTDVPIEPRLSQQWFLKYPSVEKARAVVAEGRMKFHPERWAKVYDHWMGSIQDWCISRQLWWGHRIPVWYNRLGQAALGKPILLVTQDWDEVTGKKAGEMRDNALRIALERGILNSDFRNLDTGWDISIQKSSLQHAFSRPGLEQIKLVPALPNLLRDAVLIGSEIHSPPSVDVLAVHTFLGIIKLGARLYAVKLTVKEFANRRKLYDHHAIALWEKKNGSDGKNPPEAHSLAEKLAPRPASDPQFKVADLLENVNANEELIRVQPERPGPGWEQDPDVLDTWFSSWLWPFATMGWPEQTETLKRFYPTTDLVTGPDIIFFWVARMIMAGYEFMGEPKFGLPDALPFGNVYFTGIIRDKLGRKMSKSLGNSPDPLDLIAKYGADALRFGTMRSAPLGQDVLFDEKDVELGRNFCNKLWNACRFRQMQGGAVQEEIEPSLLTSYDKWILLKLDQAIREINDAFAEYRFNEATQTLYRFFWSEYCDWYVEASKAILGRPAVSTPSGSPGAAGGAGSPEEARRINTLAVIDFVLANTLRLFHPFLPFITEELWHGMGYHEEMPEAQGGKTIMFAPWPKALGEDFIGNYGLDGCYLEIVDQRFELVSKGRNLRREANIPGGKKVKYVFAPIGAWWPPLDVEVLRLLLNAETLEVAPNYEPKKGTPAVHSELGVLYLPLEGLVDVEAERARLKKELAKADAEIAKAQERLNNPEFTTKVPANVLTEHRKRLEDSQAKRERILAALAGLEG